MRSLPPFVNPAPLAVVLAFACIGAASGQVPAGPHGPLPRGIDCADCHLTGGWTRLKEPPDFDHRRSTGFPLENRHADVRCVACHPEARFNDPGTDACGSCHVDVHQGQLGDACAGCHSTRGFDEVDGVAVHLRTTFPLTGAHLQIACSACHADDAGGAFRPLEPACVHCHRADYETASSIDHREAGFSEQCDECHGTTAWAGSGQFDHALASGGFDLVGVHGVLRCSSCHIVPGFVTRFEPAGPSDCIACHQADYDRAHAASGLDTACGMCHDQDRWTGARFADHDARFPIYSGTHRGEWDACATCHATPGSYALFTCFACHEHEQSRTDRHHEEVPSYVYESTQCYHCHPRGREEDE